MKRLWKLWLTTAALAGFLGGASGVVVFLTGLSPRDNAPAATGTWTNYGPDSKMFAVPCQYRDELFAIVAREYEPVDIFASPLTGQCAIVGTLRSGVSS